tara:strand:- start:10495 stop:10830 length:336 start_codon:yes stop_codon:yes gene_type:complete
MSKGKVLEAGSTLEKADSDGDGVITDSELSLHLEYKRKELEDADAMRDAQRKMAWFALGGMLLYPFAVVIASFAGLDEAAKILGSMAPTYFVSVAAIVAAFYAKEAYGNKK